MAKAYAAVVKKPGKQNVSLLVQNHGGDVKSFNLC